MSFRSESLPAAHPTPTAHVGRGAFVTYVGRVRDFDRTDWLVYIGWVGMMLGLVVATGALLLVGRAHGVRFPDEAWLVPVGALIFALAIAVDTIGHRTVYKADLREAEGLVHGITIFCGIGSCVLLCAAYTHPGIFAIPALVLTVLSFVYSLIDEVFHWRRYLGGRSDVVEMWSHLFIFVGHGVMMLGWWRWFYLGYVGVAETLAALSQAS
jgi:hypothetical protein